MAAAIIIIPMRWCAAAIVSCRLTFTSRAARRPRKRFCTACSCCRKKSAAPARSSAETASHGRKAARDRRTCEPHATQRGARLRDRAWRTYDSCEARGDRRCRAAFVPRPALLVLEHHRHLRRRLAGAREALRCRLSPAFAQAQSSRAREGGDRRGDAGALNLLGLCRG